MLNRQLIFLLAALVLSTGVTAQNPSQKPLTEKEYAIWKTVDNTKISPSGNLVTYEVNPQKGDGILVVWHSSGKSDTIPRGKKAEIGGSDEVVVFTITQPEDSLRKAKIRKVKREDMPQDSLGIFRTRENKVVRFPKLKSVTLPEENALAVAFLKTAEAVKDTSKAARKTKPVKQPGDDLIIYDIKSGDTTIFHRVTEFLWPKKGGSLYFVQQQKDSTGTRSSLKKYDPTEKKPEELFSEEGFIKKVVTSETGENYAFLHSRDTAQQKTYALFLGKTGQGSPVLVLKKSDEALPSGWSPSENGNCWFSQDATKLFFGTAPSPLPEPKDTIPEEEKARLDVWNWKDVALQPQQKVEQEREKKRSYLAVYHLGSRAVVQLGDTLIREVSTINKGNGQLALGGNNQPYLRESSWKGDANSDYYLIDVNTGGKRLIARDKERNSLSPGGRYLLWYEPKDSCWYARSTNPEDRKVVPLTKMIPVAFCQEENDMPDYPRPYGIAGWAENDRFVFLYDRYDIWKLDPSGEKVPVSVTFASGRKNKIRYRYVRTNPEEEYIPSGKLSLLSAFNEQNMESGFCKADFGQAREPAKLVMEKCSFGIPRKAKNSDKLIWTRETVSAFADWWISNTEFAHARRISEANPQQKEYIWPTCTMVEWTSFSGETLKGLLYQPENLDPSKKYPMIIYYYEKNSEGLYRHSAPKPSQSTINRTFYCSNGYLVFIPDITYKIGYPGQSAYDAIVSGVYHLANTRPYVDLKKVGLQGQSWGGYQTAWLITRTDLFAAAMAGAPVSNMTSAYGGIRWETGVSRMFQYEHTQSRIGATLWEKPMHYIENSPLFRAPDIHTPLLMMANDNDGAVPWYQGIELFTALRRLDKPVWMLSYNGEPHNLKGESWANRMDLDKRMFQFFNHYLKGNPMPEWMDKGLPAIMKGKKTGY